MEIMQPQRARWVLASIGVVMAVVTVALFPGECFTSLKVPAGAAAQGEEPPFDPDPVTTCETRAGIEWSSQSTGIAVVVGTDLVLLAIGLAIHARKKGPSG